MKFTPGPWKASQDEQGWFVATATARPPNRHGDPVAVVLGQSVDEANARLIAAAPELHELLRLIRNIPDDCVGDHPALVAKLDAVLAKARGKS